MWEQVGLSHSFLRQLCARLSARPCEAAPVCRQSGPLSRGRGRKRGEKGEAGSAGGLQGSRSRWGVLCKTGWRWGGSDGLGAVPQRPAPCSRSGGPRAPHWVLELFVGITRQRSHSPPSLRLGSCCLLWTLHPCWLVFQPHTCPVTLCPARSLQTVFPCSLTNCLPIGFSLLVVLVGNTEASQRQKMISSDSE